MKKASLLLFTMFGLLLWFATCQDPSKPPVALPEVAITPVPLPTNIVPGFQFPEDSNKIINQWLGGFTAQNFDTVSIYNHAWGIWAGLTAPSGQKWNNQELLVYETWPGISEIQAMTQSNDKSLKFTKLGRGNLKPPSQFGHATLRMNALKGGAIPVDSINEETGGGADLWTTVTYDPTAASHAVTNDLLKTSKLAGMVRPGQISAIPAFPNTAITLKPTYLIGKKSDQTLKIPAWPGPPTPAKNFPDTMWNSWVYIDMTKATPSGKNLVPVPDGNPTQAQIAAATGNLGDFIHYTLDSAAAAYVNQQQSSQGVKAAAGDVALLIAMHVTTKEISNWTWQTFFWAPNPDNPPFPSDAVAASLRPKQLSGAASHYALSTTYAMVRPNQPVAGGTNKNVNAVIGYNPYLEPNLGQLNTPGVNPNQLNPNYQWGVQSNCMSCHAQAYYPAKFIYTADQYVDMKNGAFYNGTVQLDFAWSIAVNLIQ
ncbi:MAG: hypothetical protein JNJ57_07050 [Saprospiraceae bacterium]|nr:hypothetical protein [Saprospiraceae bacterium]